MLAPDCKECRRKKQRKYSRENPEKRKKYNQRYYVDNKERYSYKYKDKDKFKKYQKQYRQSEHGKKILRKHSVFRSMNKTHEITNEEWLKCKDYFNYQCAYCGIDEDVAKEIQGNYLHKEHVNHEGSNDLSNCVPSCKSCNSSKYNKEMKEWYKSRDYYDEERLQKIYKWLEEDHLK